MNAAPPFVTSSLHSPNYLSRPSHTVSCLSISPEGTKYIDVEYLANHLELDAYHKYIPPVDHLFDICDDDDQLWTYLY